MDIEDFVKCVMNLLALLPSDVRLEVQKREGAILRAIEKEKEAFCGPPPPDYISRDDYFKCIKAKAGEIARKVAEELNAKSYYFIIYFLLTTGREAFTYCQHLLDLSLAIDVLHERGLIGFEEKPLYVGVVDVSRKPNKMGDKP
jgi:hypothetical protein